MRGIRSQLIVATILIIVICAALYVWVDHPLALYMAQFRHTPAVRIFEVITNLANSAIWYGVALAGIGLAWRARRRDDSPASHTLYARRFRAAMFILVSMIASGLVVNGLKLVIGRSRPKFLVDSGIADFAPFHRALAACSFPSGHSQSIWAAMIALAWIAPRWRPAFFVVAIIVSSSRVIIGAHYASDVIAGAFFAFAIALLVRERFERATPLCLQTA